jgi:hypothetical protein
MHLEGCDHANLEAIFVGVKRYTLRLSSSEFGDALGGRERWGLVMHLKTEIEQEW